MIAARMISATETTGTTTATAIVPPGDSPELLLSVPAPSPAPPVVLAASPAELPDWVGETSVDVIRIVVAVGPFPLVGVLVTIFVTTVDEGVSEVFESESVV